MPWIDIMVLIVLIVGVTRGYRRGLILTLTSIVSFVGSIVIAGLFYKDLSQYVINNTGVGQKLTVFISENIRLGDGTMNTWIEGSNISTFPEGAKGYISASLTENANSFLSQSLSESISQVIIQALVFIVLFFGVRVLFSILGHLIDGVFKLPGLSLVNKAGGGIVGLIEGILINILIVSMVYTLAIFINQGSLVDAVNNSTLAQYFYLGYIFY